MIPQTVRHWLAGCYSESEVRGLVGGTRQNWSKRRPKLRLEAGVELLPGTWVYERQTIDAILGTKNHPQPNPPALSIPDRPKA